MAISRYEFSNLIRDEKTNKNRYGLFPPIKAEELMSADDIVIQIKEGDRLDSLAASHLGDGRLWWAICLMNDIKMPLGDSLLPGSYIRIPTDVSRLRNLIQGKYNEK